MLCSVMLFLWAKQSQKWTTNQVILMLLLPAEEPEEDGKEENSSLRGASAF